MPYCPRCGVEADASVRTCPLCETAIPELPGLGPGEPAWPREALPDDPSKVYATPRQLRTRAFQAVSSVLGAAALAVAASDLVLFGGVTWSRWPLLSLAAVWGLVATALVWRRSAVGWTASWALVLGAFLAALDLAGGGFDWAPRLGLPLVGITFGLGWLGAWAVRRTRRRGYNLLALVPGLSAVFLVAIDTLVSSWLGLGFRVGWSLVTSLVLVPLATLFLLLHFALRRTPDLKRIFHF